MASKIKCSAPEIHLLGEIVVLFNKLELILEAAICTIRASGDSERFVMAQALTADMSFGLRVKAFNRIIASKRGIANSEKAHFKELLKKLREAEAARNQLIHSDWNDWGGQGFTRMKVQAKGVNRQVYDMPVKEIEKTQDLIRTAIESLMIFHACYIEAPKLEP